MNEGNPDKSLASSNLPKAKLDDLMLAMDVVDTLRHQEKLIERELGQQARDDTLKKRLREIYEGQGLEVSDRILDEGIQALKESRFTYEPSGSTFQRFLAMFWVRRGLAFALFGVALVAISLVIGGIWWQAKSERQAAEAERIEITETLPQELAKAAESAREEARDEEAIQAVDRLQAEGENAIQRTDRAAARLAIANLEKLRDTLFATYDLVIVQDGQSGVFRIPDVNQATRNYYLIVEAITPDGRKLTIPVENEETGSTENVSKWAVRVPENTYLSVRRDKEDDGIISDRILGTKPRGSLQPNFQIAVSGGNITSW